MADPIRVYQDEGNPSHLKNQSPKSGKPKARHAHIAHGVVDLTTLDALGKQLGTLSHISSQKGQEV